MTFGWNNIFGLLLGSVLLAPLAQAQADGAAGPNRPASRMEAAPDELKGITVDEHLGLILPLDAAFRDDQNQPVTLRQYFDNAKKPVVLQLGYYGCPMLCDLVSRGLLKSMKDVELSAGTDYDVVFVSIDPNETWTLAQAKKRAFLHEYGRGGAAGVHFLTGTQREITKVAKAVGVNYKWVPSSAQFSHPAVIAIAAPDGKLTRYLYGVQFDKQTLRLSLVESSQGKIGTTTDRFLLTCFQFDGQHGRYAMTAMTLMRIGGALTALILGTVLFVAFRRESRRRANEQPSGDPTPTPV